MTTHYTVLLSLLGRRCPEFRQCQQKWWHQIGSLCHVLLVLFCFQTCFKEVRSQTPTTPPSISVSPSMLPSALLSAEPSILLMEPSAEPSKMPSFTPSNSPTIVPLSEMPSALPSQLPSSEPSVAEIISGAPSTTPSTTPSRSSNPTSFPSNTPSTSAIPSSIPTAVPSESASPSTAITGIPSALPSQFPSTQISLEPSLFPTKSPAPSEPNSTTRPTELITPTVAPVNQPVLPVSQNVRGLSIILSRMTTELSEPARDAFIREMSVVIETFYRVSDTSSRSLRRFLQQRARDVVSDVDATVFVRSQELRPVDDNSELEVTFDTTISYNILVDSQSSIEPVDVVAEPLTDRSTREMLTGSLKSSHSDYASLASVSELSIPQEGNGIANNETDDDDGLGLPAIIGIAVGGAVLVALFIGFGIYKNRDAAERHDPLPGTIDPPPPRNEYMLSGEVASVVSDNITYDDAKSAGGRGDQSIETIDYDYSKAYGGGEQSVVSSAGGTMGENTREASSQALPVGSRFSGRAALGASFDSEVGANSANQEPIIQEQTIEISAPSGKLGVVIDTPNSGPPVVHAVKESSVIAHLISVGDQLIMVDDIDVSDMTAIKVSKLISKKSANPQRKLTVVRKIVIDPSGPIP